MFELFDRDASSVLNVNVRDGEHVIVVESVDDAFVRAIDDLLKNKTKREFIGKNARNLAKESYNWDNIANKLRALYCSVIDQIKRSGNKQV